MGQGAPAVEKVVVHCICGKRYRVPGEGAGRRFSCRRCRVKLTVPEPLLDSDRVEILTVMGIDPGAAERAYRESVRRRKRREKERRASVRRCGLCYRPLAKSETLDELGYCSGCNPPGEPPATTSASGVLERWTTHGESPELAALKVVLLVLVGAPGFVHYGQALFTTPRLWLTVLVTTGLVAFAWASVVRSTGTDA